METSGVRPKLLALVGETASGKSDLALKIAKNYRGEVISADSWAIYKGFDVGTGKPTAAQQKAVKHHLISVRRPTDGFNAPMFKEVAEKAIGDIQKRGKLPILAGGTGLYIDSVLYDFGFLPDSDEREKLNSMTLKELLNLAKSRRIDLTGIDIRNKRRVIRAVEAGGEKPTRQKLRNDVVIIGLRLFGEELRRRAAARVDKMLAGGLEAEVKKLSNRYSWDIEPMKGIGYREWRGYFEGEQTLEETRRKIISDTISLAKRQRTWFKRNPDIHWFTSTDEALSFLTQIL